MPIFFGIWPLLIQSATLQPLKVKELDKCLTRHNLPSVGISNNTPVTRNDESDNDSEHDSESESGSDDDEVTRIIPEDEDDSTNEEQLSKTKLYQRLTDLAEELPVSYQEFRIFSLLVC